MHIQRWSKHPPDADVPLKTRGKRIVQDENVFAMRCPYSVEMYEYHTVSRMASRLRLRFGRPAIQISIYKAVKRPVFAFIKISTLSILLSNPRYNTSYSLLSQQSCFLGNQSRPDLVLFLSLRQRILHLSRQNEDEWQRRLLQVPLQELLLAQLSQLGLGKQLAMCDLHCKSLPSMNRPCQRCVHAPVEQAQSNEPRVANMRETRLKAAMPKKNRCHPPWDLMELSHFVFERTSYNMLSRN